MAHKGKTYPVLERRDWNLNVNNNNDGWANRYLVSLVTQTTGFGTLACQFKYDCGPATNSFVSLMTWTSQVFTFGPFDFQMQLHADIIQAVGGYDTRIELYENHVGIIASWRPYPAGTKAIGFTKLDPQQITHWDPAWFDSDPGFVNIPIPEKVWLDGPPH